MLVAVTLSQGLKCHISRVSVSRLDEGEDDLRERERENRALPPLSLSPSLSSPPTWGGGGGFSPLTSCFALRSSKEDRGFGSRFGTLIDVMLARACMWGGGGCFPGKKMNTTSSFLHCRNTTPVL